MKIINEVDLALHCEMFSCLDNDIDEKGTIEILSQILHDDFSYKWDEAEVYADIYYNDNFLDIDKEVSRARRANTEDYREKMRDYEIMVGATA